MLISKAKVLGTCLVLSLSASFAQDFPADASAPSGEEIKKYMEAGVLSAALADGTTWRLEYKPSGQFFINTSRGFNADGRWQAEEGKLCGAIRGRDRTCNDVRMHKGILHYKRDNGEIVQFKPK
jgi:hypothetical protein